MGWLSALATFLGKLLKEILPTLFKIGKAPREVKPVGNDSDLKKDINQEINNQLDEIWSNEKEPMAIQLICQKCTKTRTVVAGDFTTVDAGCNCGGKYIKL